MKQKVRISQNEAFKELVLAAFSRNKHLYYVSCAYCLYTDEYNPNAKFCINCGKPLIKDHTND